MLWSSISSGVTSLTSVFFLLQSQWLVAVQLGAGEDLPADRWNL